MGDALSDLPLRHTVFFRPDAGAEGLSTLLDDAGHEIRRPGDDYSWDGLKRGSDEHFIWQYTLAGRGRVRIGKAEQDVLPGEAMLLGVPEDHRYWLPDDSECWEFLYVTLSGAEAVRLGLEARNRLGPVVRHAAHAPVVRAAAAILSGGLEGRIKTRYETSARAYGFLMDLMGESNATLRGRKTFPIERAQEYCMAHLAEPISVEDLARAADLSRWHFSRRFLAATGVAPHQYILDARMALAVYLLRNTRLAVKEVAHRCGYEDPSYFCKVFKTSQGAAPGEFRG